MKLITVLLVSLTSTFFSHNSVAEDKSYGVGIALNDGLHIFFPIRTSTYILEPSIIFTDNKNGSTISPVSQRHDTSTLLIGLGIFDYLNVAKDSGIYFGTRFGYVEGKEGTTTSQSVGTSTISVTRSAKEDGFFIAPTFGAEYKFARGFSISLDVSLIYRKTDKKITTIDSMRGTTVVDSNSKRFSSAASLIARYMF